MALEQGGQTASSTQARTLEYRHKQLFADLVGAFEKYHAGRDHLYRPDGSVNPNSPFKNPLLQAHASKLMKSAHKWIKRQNRYEKIQGSNAQFSVTPIRVGDFVSGERFKYLQSLRDKLDAEQKISGTGMCKGTKRCNGDSMGVWDSRSQRQIGFIPLIIWAVIAIAGAFTAVEIVDEINTTTEEQAELTETTNNFCKDNNLTDAQCTALLQQQIESTEGGFPWKWILIGTGAFVAVKYVLPKAKEYYGKKRQSAA